MIFVPEGFGRAFTALALLGASCAAPAAPATEPDRSHLAPPAFVAGPPNDPRDPLARREAIFMEAWRVVAEGYFDPTFAGRHWAADRDRYRLPAVHAPDDATFERLTNEMLAGLGPGCARLSLTSPAPLPPPGPEPVSVVMLDRAAKAGGGRVGVLRLPNLDADVGLTKVEPALADLIASRPAAIILDARGSTRGDLPVALALAARLVAAPLPLGSVLGRGTETPLVAEPARAPPMFAGPVAVLLGPRTAGAAEVLAAGLNTAGRAVLVGQRSAGLPLGLSEHALAHGASLVMARGGFRDARGRRVDGVGVVPGREAFGAPSGGSSGVPSGRDAVLDAALDAIGPSARR